MFRLYKVNYLETSSSSQVKSCIVFASSVNEALSLLPESFVVKDIVSSFKIDYYAKGL